VSLAEVAWAKQLGVEFRTGVRVGKDLPMDRLIAEMDQAVQMPGLSNAWTMPIKARTDMLSTGIRTPIGIKVFGTDLAEMERVARDIERVVQLRTTSAYAERTTGGYHRYRVRRARTGPLRNYGDVQEVVATALGGEIITTTVEGDSGRCPLSAGTALRPDNARRAGTVDGGMVPLVARKLVVRGGRRHPHRKCAVICVFVKTGGHQHRRRRHAVRDRVELGRATLT
jgi:Cu(I)/Ag(I) efflux system membrane protein CusA/SilA